MIQKEKMHMRKTYSNENDKLLLTIKDACQITGLCYNTMRKVLNEPSCMLIRQFYQAKIY